MTSSFRAQRPSLLLGAGLITGTLVAVLASGWFTLIGPAILAVTTVAAAVVAVRQGCATTRAVPASWCLAGGIAAASLLAALADPSRVALLMPILGAAGMVVAGQHPEAPSRCWWRRARTGGRV